MVAQQPARNSLLGRHDAQAQSARHAAYAAMVGGGRVNQPHMSIQPLSY